MSGVNYFSLSGVLSIADHWREQPNHRAITSARDAEELKKLEEAIRTGCEGMKIFDAMHAIEPLEPHKRPRDPL